MFEIAKNLIHSLNFVLIITFIISNLPAFKRFIQKDEYSRFDLVILGIIFSFFGIAGTYLGTNVNGAVASTRIIGVMAGGILCGPFVGIVSGIITGIHRILYDIQGITSIACGLTTVIAGFVSAFIYTRDKKYSKWVYGLIGGIFVVSIEMLLVLFISRPTYMAFNIVKSIYLPLSFANAIGICIVILLIQKIFDEKDQASAIQAQLSLEIANKTLPYFRDINDESLQKICSIIKDSTDLAAVSITDKHRVLAYSGLDCDYHSKKHPINPLTTGTVFDTGKHLILNTSEEIKCQNLDCNLKSCIIVPLYEGNEVTKTLKLYSTKEKGISYTHEKLALGLSQLMSTQMELSKVTNLKALATKAEIKALQAQINPHFLFNSLNTIVSFVRINPDKARDLIVNLSVFLRYNIEESNGFVDITKEIEQVKAYIAIEQARFGDKLKIEYDIDNDIKLTIPSLIIQPIVENAIKHGVLESKGKGKVVISIKKQNEDSVLVTIEDDGFGVPDEVIDSLYSETHSQNKIGMANVHNRLKHLYGNGLKIENLKIGTKISFVLKQKEAVL